MTTILEKHPGYEKIKLINTEIDYIPKYKSKSSKNNYSFDVNLFKYALITTCEVERSFSIYRSFFRKIDQISQIKTASSIFIYITI